MSNIRNFIFILFFIKIEMFSQNVVKENDTFLKAFLLKEFKIESQDQFSFTYTYTIRIDNKQKIILINPNKNDKLYLKYFYKIKSIINKHYRYLNLKNKIIQIKLDTDNDSFIELIL